MFLRNYTDFQLGRVQPIGFRRAEATKQIYALSYDKSIQFPPDRFCLAAGAMDIDSSERFLLTGHQDGFWSIVDCWTTDSNEGNPSFRLVKDGHSLEKPRYSMSSVFWHIDSGMFSTCSWHGTVNIYDANKAKRPLRTVGEPGYVEYVKHTVSPTDQTLIAATNRVEKTVGFIDLRIGTEIQVLPSILSSFVPTLRFSPKSQFLITVGTELGQVVEWDLRSTLTYLHHFEDKNLYVARFSEAIPPAHLYNVSSLKYSEDGQHLFTYGVDKTLHKFCTATAHLEETVVLDCNTPKMLQYLEIYVFENLEIPIVAVPYNKYLHLANMADGVAKVITRIKCSNTVNGFIFNRTLLKGFCYGKACTVFAPDKTRDQYDDRLQESGGNRVPNALIDISDL